MISNATINNCEKPKIISLENASYMFWMEENKLVFSNNFSTPSTIFEEPGLSNYDVLLDEGAIVLCLSIYEGGLFLLKMKKYKEKNKKKKDKKNYKKKRMRTHIECGFITFMTHLIVK